MEQEYISHKTATELKMLGLPQPEKAIGQAWYCDSGTQWIVCKLCQMGRLVFACLTDTRWKEISEMPDAVFAATAPYLLKLSKGSANWNESLSAWEICAIDQNGFFVGESVLNENLAEAAADFWKKVCGGG